MNRQNFEQQVHSFPVHQHIDLFFPFQVSGLSPLAASKWKQWTHYHHEIPSLIILLSWLFYIAATLQKVLSACNSHLHFLCISSISMSAGPGAAKFRKGSAAVLMLSWSPTTVHQERSPRRESKAPWQLVFPNTQQQKWWLLVAILPHKKKITACVQSDHRTLLYDLCYHGVITRFLTTKKPP